MFVPGYETFILEHEHRALARIFVLGHDLVRAGAHNVLIEYELVVLEQKNKKSTPLVHHRFSLVSRRRVQDNNHYVKFDNERVTVHFI